MQYIRTASILRTLLGNIGRPGRGIMALRGHASIQGSTDIPTLFDLLPGYLPMPHAHSNQDLDSYCEAERTQKGHWADIRAYTVSLPKAWWGEAATPDNDFWLVHQHAAAASMAPSGSRADRRRARGRYMNTGKVLTVLGAAGSVLGSSVRGRGGRVADAVSGTALLAASAATRRGVFHAGLASARDPRYTVMPQRERLPAR